jgi:hypothetical protein
VILGFTWTIRSCTATTVTVSAAADSWLLQSSPTSTFGNDSVLKVDTKAGANARGGGLEQGFHSRQKGTDEPPRLVVAFG